MPALWLLLLGLVLMRRRTGRMILVTTGILLLVGSTPVFGGFLLGFLEHGAQSFEDDRADASSFDAIVVPLGGAYADPVGRWWPLPGSVLRTVRGQQIQSETGLPLIVVGGAPFPNQTEAEAIALQRVITLMPNTIVEATAQDTFQTAEAVSSILKDFERVGSAPRVILVTSGFHVRRMAASLRRFGIEVAVPPARRYADVRISRNAWLDLVPCERGLRIVRRALHETYAITWYLVTGRIGLRHL